MTKEITGWTIRPSPRFAKDDELLPVYLHADGEWRKEPYVFRDKAMAELRILDMPWRVIRRVVRKKGYVVRYKRADGTLTHYIDKDGWWGERHVFTDRAEAVWHVSVNPYRLCGRVLLRVR